eukprot:943959_1
MSPFQYVLAELRNKDLARHLMAAGAQLYSYEICLLNELFVNYELEEEAEWEVPPPIEEEELEEELEDEWDITQDFVQHEADVERDDSWLQLLCDVAKHCGRPIHLIADATGDNPLHHFLNTFSVQTMHTTAEHANIQLRFTRLRHLMHISKGAWSNVGIHTLIIKKRDPRLVFAWADLSPDFKAAIMEKKEHVQALINWIIAITERITKKYPQGLMKDRKSKAYVDVRVQADVDVQTLDKLFRGQYFGKLIKWPNKYKKDRNAKEISLIGCALDRHLFEVTSYLKKYWKFPVTKSGRDKIKELQDIRE